MEWLMEALYTLEEVGTIVSHKTGVFAQNIRHIKQPFKGSTVSLSSLRYFLPSIAKENNQTACCLFILKIKTVDYNSLDFVGM